MDLSRDLKAGISGQMAREAEGERGWVSLQILGNYICMSPYAGVGC